MRSHDQGDPHNMVDTKFYSEVIITISCFFGSLNGRSIIQFLCPLSFFLHVGASDQLSTKDKIPFLSRFIRIFEKSEAIVSVQLVSVINDSLPSVILVHHQKG